MLRAVSTDATSKLFLIVDSDTAKTWAILGGDSFAFPQMTPNGGMVAGIPVIVSDGFSAATMVLVDAHQIAAGSDTVTVDASLQADVQLDTAPNSPASASTVRLGLWQRDMTAIKVERFFGAERLRSTAVAVCSGVGYGNSP